VTAASGAQLSSLPCEPVSDEAVPSPPAVVRPASLPAAPDAVPALHHRVRTGRRHSHNWIQLVRVAVADTSGYIINLVVGAACVHAMGQAVAAMTAVPHNFVGKRLWSFRA